MKVTLNLYINIMAKYRQKPVIVEAIQWTGDNKEEIEKFSNRPTHTFNGGTTLVIRTKDGAKSIIIGDYVLKDKEGKISICIESFFNNLYEKIED